MAIRIRLRIQLRILLLWSGSFFDVSFCSRGSFVTGTFSDATFCDGSKLGPYVGVTDPIQSLGYFNRFLCQKGGSGKNSADPTRSAYTTLRRENAG
jgi:hypothetical protein